MRSPRLSRAAAASALALALGIPRSPAGAEAPSGVDALVAEALEKSPDLAAARAAVDAARSRVAPAGALPDPMLRVQYENDGTAISLGQEPMSLLSFMAEQALPYPGKLRLAGSVAEADARLAGARLARLALTIEADVRRAAARLAEARESLAVTGEQETAWAAIEEVTRGRYAAGLASQQDVLRAQVERTRLRQQRRRDEAAGRTAQVELGRLLLRDDPATLAVETALPGAPLAPPDRKETLARAEERSPELAEARLRQEREGLSADLARRNLAPDFVASAGYSNRGSLPMMWQVGVGVSIPLFSGRKQKPLVAAAESGVAAAKAGEAVVRTRLRARTDERLALLAQLADESALDAGTLLVQDRLAVEAALASYRSGTVPFVTVLEAVAVEFGDRRAAVARRAAFARTLADLDELSLESSPPMPQAASASPSPSSSAAPGM